MQGRPSRRDVLKAGLAPPAARCAASAACPPRSSTRIAATQPACGTLGDVEHIVIFIQENRSFDHYFGRYKGVRGFDDRTVRLSATDDGTDGLQAALPGRRHPRRARPAPPLPHRHHAALDAAG